MLIVRRGAANGDLDGGLDRNLVVVFGLVIQHLLSDCSPYQEVHSIGHPTAFQRLEGIYCNGLGATGWFHPIRHA